MRFVVQHSQHTQGEQAALCASCSLIPWENRQHYAPHAPQPWETGSTLRRRCTHMGREATLCADGVHPPWERQHSAQTGYTHHERSSTLRRRCTPALGGEYSAQTVYTHLRREGYYAQTGYTHLRRESSMRLMPPPIGERALCASCLPPIPQGGVYPACLPYLRVVYTHHASLYASNGCISPYMPPCMPLMGGYLPICLPMYLIGWIPPYMPPYLPVYTPRRIEPPWAHRASQDRDIIDSFTLYSRCFDGFDSFDKNVRKRRP